MVNKIGNALVKGYIDDGSLSPIDPSLWQQTGKPITAYGNATQLTMKFNQTAAFFNGSTDIVTIPHHSDLNLGSSDFCLETFMMLDSTGASGTSNNQMFRKIVTVNQYCYNTTYIHGTGFRMNYYTDGVNAITTDCAYTASPYVWYHIAWVRYNNTLKCYINGVAHATTRDMTGVTVFAGTSDLLISLASVSGMKGWLKEMRISNTARYTGNFTPPVSQFVSDANTTLLLHMDSPATSPIAPAIEFSGTNYLQTPASTDFDLGTGDLTIECWVCFRAGSLGAIWELGHYDATGLLLQFNTGALYIYFNGGSTITATFTPKLGSWYHIVVKRTSGLYRIFANGVSLTSGASAGSINSGSFGFTIGRVYVGNNLYGYVKQLRVSNIARPEYPDTGFIPPTTDLVVDSNTKFYVKGTETGALGGSIVPSMTANNAPAPYVASASTEYSATYAAWHAFDGATADASANSWIAQSGVTTGWLKIDLSIPRVVSAYRIFVTPSDGTDRFPKTWTVQGSNNNVSWTTLDTQTNYAFTGNHGAFSFSNTTAYRYYKLDITANNGSATILEMNEWILCTDYIKDYSSSPKAIGYYGAAIPKIVNYEDNRLHVFTDSSPILSNGGFEMWSAGASSAPDQWGLGGAGASIAREGTIVHGGTYSAKLTRNGTNAYIQQDMYTALGTTAIRGQSVTFGCWVYATVANRAFLVIADNIGSANSAYHSGTAGWEYLTVTRTIDNAATIIYANCYVVTGDTEAYFDDAVITTQSGKHKPYTTAGTDAKVDFVAPCGTGCGAFMTDTDYTSMGTSSDFDFGTGPFTLETWVRFTLTGDVRWGIMGKMIGSNEQCWGWLIAPNTSNYNQIYGGTASASLSITPPVGYFATQTWFHIAIVKDTTLRFYMNGVQYGAAQTPAASYDGAATLMTVARAYGTATTNGYLDQVRVTKGKARWITSFTPPTSLTTDYETKLLMNMDGTGNTFVDSEQPTVTNPTEQTILDQWTRTKVLLDYSVNSGSAVMQPIVSTYSLAYTTTTAFNGGVLASNGDVHFIPRATTVGMKMSSTGVLTTYALVTAAQYFGGVLAPNGDIHFCTLQATVGQKVSAAGVVSTYAYANTSTTVSLHAGGVLALNGDIHLIPYSATVGQKVNTYTGIVSTYSLVYTTSLAYIGGCLAPNGDIHFSPGNATVGQKISKDGVVSTYSLVYTTPNAYMGGVIDVRGDIHFIPRSASVGQKINPITGVVSTYSLIYTASAAYLSGVLAPDGSIYFIPYQTNIGQRVSSTGVVSTFSLPYSVGDGYYGGLVLPNGEVHFMPSSAAVGMKLTTLPARPFSQTICCSPWFNKI